MLAINWPTRSVPFSMCPGCKPYLLNANSDWDLVVKFLHHSGTFKGLLNSDEEFIIRYRADGFGLTTNPDLIWDWSHVRDSSDAAVCLMADAIRDWVNSQPDTHTSKFYDAFMNKVKR